MPDVISCPKCRRRLRLDGDLTGVSVRCPACEAVFVPAPLPPIAEAVPVPDEPSPERAPSVARPRRLIDRLIITGAIGCGGVLILLLIGLVALVSRVASEADSLPPSPPVAVDDDAFEESRTTREESRLAPEYVPEVADVLASLGKALAANNAAHAAGHFLPRRTFEELEAAGVVPRLEVRRRFDQVLAFEDAVRETLALHAPTFHWTRTEVRAVRAHANDLEAVAVARHFGPAGELHKVRWWLVREAGRWRVYDYEDLDTNLPFRYFPCAALHGVAGWPPLDTVRQSLTPLIEASNALSTGDLAAAEGALDGIQFVPLPRSLEAMREVMHAHIHLRRGKHPDLAAALARAEAARPNLPSALYLRGTSDNWQRAYARALPPLQKYQDVVGDDGPLCEQLGIAAEGLYRHEQARRYYRTSLDFTPTDIDPFLGLLRTAGPGNRDDIPDRYAKLRKPETFEACAAACVARLDGVGLEQVVAAEQRFDPAAAALDHYLALARIWADRANEATALFAAALKKETDADKRQDRARQFFTQMARADKAALAYEAAPDEVEAFKLLAAETRGRKGLRGLTDAHAKKHPDDNLLPFYRAQVRVLEGKYEAAEKEYVRGMKAPPPREVLEQFRANRVLTRYYLGQPLTAYQDVGPRRETFEQLALLLYDDEDAAGLAALLAAHRAKEPDDPALLRWGCKAKVQQGKTAEAVALFKAAVARERQEEARGRIVTEFLHDMQAAGKAVDAYEAAPDANVAFDYLMEAMEDEGQSAVRRELIRRHRAKDPQSAAVRRYEASLLAEEKEWARAADLYADVWRTSSPEEQEQLRWQHLTALYRAGRWRQAYEEVTPRDKAFPQLGNLLVGDKKLAELEELLQLHRPHSDDTVVLNYYEARAKLLAGKAAEAVARFGPLLKQHAEEPKYRVYETLFVAALADEGRFEDAYRVATHKAGCLNTLYHSALEKKKAAEVLRVIEQARKDLPDEYLPDYVCGELHLELGDVPAAEAAFGRAAARPAAKRDFRLRQGVMKALVRAGRAVEEYRKDEGEFDALARACVGEKHAGQLEALLAEHRRRDADDGDLLQWELELRWLKQDYAGAAKWVQDHRRELGRNPYLRWTAAKYRVRGLLLSRQADAAARELADRRTAKLAGPVLAVLLPAVRGDVVGTVRAVQERAAGTAGLVRECYADEHLGELLRAGQFDLFRVWYPEPADDE